MNYSKIDDQTIIQNSREELYKRFNAPLDSMWQDLFIAAAPIYLIEDNNINIGYCCIDDKNCLLQIYLEDGCNRLMKSIVLDLISSGLIVSASLSSIEPISFNTCLSLSKSTQENSFCYELEEDVLENSFERELTAATQSDAKTVRGFYKKHIGFDDNFGYVDNLIAKEALYLIKENGEILATGECRVSVTQKSIADIGMAVNANYRGNGIGTDVLKQLVNIAKKVNRKPICSTTVDNIASQKAIAKVGFYCAHIIFDMSFEDK